MEFLNDLRVKTFGDVDQVKDFDGVVEGFMIGTFPDLFKKVIDDVAESEIIIVEVGSYKGLSAVTMADICKSKSLNFKIVCVDTWLGSPEHIEYLDQSQQTLYKTFLKNVKSMSHDDVIYPFPISSTQAAQYLKNKKVIADIIYIDAGHEYEAVKGDIEMYWDVLKPGGTMIFDDYGWDGVKKAVDEFLEGGKFGVSVVNYTGYQMYVKKALPGQMHLVIERSSRYQDISNTSINKIKAPEGTLCCQFGPYHLNIPDHTIMRI